MCFTGDKAAISVNPARAGMILVAYPARSSSSGKPRASGDDPAGPPHGRVGAQ